MAARSHVKVALDTARARLSREELRSIQRELEVLSEQYSQKCLENAHLARALEAERQALGRCRRENRELHAHNQVCTLTRRRSRFPLPQLAALPAGTK